MHAWKSVVTAMTWSPVLACSRVCMGMGLPDYVYLCLSTLCLKKVDPFYSCDYSVTCWPILIILGSVAAEKICNRMTYSLEVQKSIGNRLIVKKKVDKKLVMHHRQLTKWNIVVKWVLESKLNKFVVSNDVNYTSVTEAYFSTMWFRGSLVSVTCFDQVSAHSLGPIVSCTEQHPSWEQNVYVVVVAVYLFRQANKTCNNNTISFTKLGSQKGKWPSCWPPTAQTE